jgi:Transposase DDE domain group 1
LRAGNAGSARGASTLLAEAIGTAKAVLAAQHSSGGELVVRADSAFCGRKFIATCRRAGVRFSVTIPLNKKVKAAIDTVPDDGWVEIAYPRPVWDEDQQRFVSRAQIAERTYTAFSGRWRVTARLIVRRIPDLRKSTVDSQGRFFPLWRYHAVFTDSRFVLVQSEEQRRGHAVVEQLFAEIIDGPLAHLPSGKFNANNAWLTCIGMAHNLTPDRRRARQHRRRPRSHYPAAPGPHCRQRRPARPHHDPAHARILALAAPVAAALERGTRPARLTVHLRRSRRPSGQPRSSDNQSEQPGDEAGRNTLRQQPITTARSAGPHAPHHPWIKA